jgi:hypothetical protein
MYFDLVLHKTSSTLEQLLLVEIPKNEEYSIDFLKISGQDTRQIK